MKIEKLQLTPAYQALSVDLRQRIVAGEIQPGEPLPTEADLAQSYGVHRSTVREGLRHLEQDGFEVTYLPVQENGLIDLDQLRAAPV